MDKHILEKSISSTVWNKLIRKGSFGGDALLRRDVKNLVPILKLMKEPGALLLPLLDAICQKFPSVGRDKVKVLMRCPNHAKAHRVSFSGRAFWFLP